MKHFSLIILLLGIHTGFSQEIIEPKLESDRYNILWIVNEDMGSFIPAFGDSTVETPNLSRLAAEGVRYTNVYSPSGVCAPSRAAISLGMYPSHVGAHHMRTGGNPKFYPKTHKPYEAVPPPEVKMHGQYMRELGYYATNNSKEDYQYKKSIVCWDESSREAHWRKGPKDKPFFSIFNFTVTHESQIWVRANDSLWIDENHPVPVPPYLPDNEVGRTDVRRMYSNIKMMDKQVGDILAQLEEDGLLEKTIIFWYPDHGGPLPRMKRLCYDSGLKVPMIIRFPGAQHAGKVDDRLISFIDFLPTLLSLTGTEPPEYLDGQAFLGKYRAEKDRDYIHAAGDRFDAKYDMIRAVRDHRFKYLRNYQPEKPYYLPVAYREQMPIMQELLRLRDAGELTRNQALWFRDTKSPEELFDLENDPHELYNLAGNPAYADKLAELSAECDRWMTEIDDKGLIEEKEFVNSIWPGMVQPTTSTPTFTKTKRTITLSCETDGAAIGFQIIGKKEEPNENAWSVYTGPINLPKKKKIVAKAHRIGYAISESVEIR